MTRDYCDACKKEAKVYFYKLIWVNLDCPTDPHKKTIVLCSNCLFNIASASINEFTKIKQAHDKPIQ